MSLTEQMGALWQGLFNLGKRHPDHLLQLCSVVSSQTPTERSANLLRTLAQELPQMLSHTTEQDLHVRILQCIAGSESINTLQNEDMSTSAFRLFVSFRELQELIYGLSYTQLLNITNNMIPPAPEDTQLQFMQRIQQMFQTWSPEMLKQLNGALVNCPLHSERQQLLSMEPSIAWECLHFLIELLKMPFEELESFKGWIAALSPHRTRLFLRFLQLEPPVVLLVKQTLESQTPIIEHTLPTQLSHSNNNNAASSNNNNNTTTASNSASNNYPSASSNSTNTIPSQPQAPSEALSLESDPMDMTIPPGGLQLRLMRQPPPQTVYQRILKPFPSVMVVSDSPQQNPLNSTFFVEVALLKSNSDEEVGSLLEGTRVVRVQGQFANFNKLKIMQTSQQASTLFRLRFVLKKYVGNEFQLVPNAIVYSTPIEVFSHSIYITGKQAQSHVSPPAIFEMLPSSGQTGSRVCILGANFINSDKLRVRFGQTDVHPIFHESGTLICTVPAPTAASLQYPCPVRVSNDGENFCQTKVFFSYFA